MFEPHNDTISNMEAPAVVGHFLTADGADWASRKDNVVDKIMSNVKLSHDDYWQYKKYINARQWFELDLFLDRLLTKVDEEDTRRIGEAKKSIAQAMGDKLNG